MTGAADSDDAFAEWCIVELLGHRRLAGHVREVQLAGAGFLRLDVPATDGHAAQTQFIAPGSVYALHPVGEAVARAAAAHARPEPVHRWELPAPDPRTRADPDGRAGDDEWDGDQWDDTAGGADGPTGHGDADLRAAAADTGGRT